MRSQEKVREAIIQRLQTRSGLDLGSLDITTTNVSFDKNMAYATVAFHPKGDPRVDSGMTMKYTLEARDGKWVVVRVGGGGPGHGGTGQPGAANTGLPPGHPPIGNPQSPQGQTQ